MRIAIIFVALFLASCGPHLQQGTVVGKRHEPERSTLVILPMRISCGTNCSSTMMIPYYIYDDEDWVLTIAGKDEDGNTIAEDWYVSEDRYQHIQELDDVSITYAQGDRNDPDTKVRKI